MRQIKFDKKTIINHMVTSKKLADAIALYADMWKRRSKSSSKRLVFLNGTYFDGRTVEENIDYIKKCVDMVGMLPCKFVIIRNSLTNPELFKEVTDFGKIMLIPDYTIATVGPINILCVGGNVTINRSWKRKNANRKNVVFFEDEKPYFDETTINEICESDMPSIDIILTTMSPTYVGENINYMMGTWKDKDSELFNDMFNSRSIFDEIVLRLRKSDKLPSVWCFNGPDELVDKINITGTMFLPCSGMLEDLRDMTCMKKNRFKRPRRSSIKDAIREEENVANPRRGFGMGRLHLEMPRFDIPQAPVWEPAAQQIREAIEDEELVDSPFDGTTDSDDIAESPTFTEATSAVLGSDAITTFTNHTDDVGEEGGNQGVYFNPEALRGQRIDYASIYEDMVRRRHEAEQNNQNRQIVTNLADRAAYDGYYTVTTSTTNAG